jgi:sulfhydrogenase subunit beta (sulfur reductase)
MPAPMEIKFILRGQLPQLVAELVEAEVGVIAPARRGDARDTVGYAAVRSFDDVAFDARPDNALKSFFLPSTEPLLRYERRGQDVTLSEVSSEFGPRVVLGALPCDAAGLPIVDRVMDWDYRDEPWFGRRAATTVIALACDKADDACFCTGVGLAPDSPQGADILLVPAGDGYLAEVHSDKGQAFVDQHAALFGEPREADAAQAFRAGLADGLRQAEGLDPAAARQWIEAHFMDPHWAQLGLACHGCGACAMVCPTCHCFDIVDEQEGVAAGTRRRNHDTCQYGLFTLHGAGHNPRGDQGARIRQRISHKFAIYPDRFDAILCTGCGRCSRACAAGIDMLEVVRTIGEKQADIDEETPTGGAL